MALLVLVHKGLTLKRIPLEKAEIRIGRKTDSDVFIDDMLASKRHARIEVLPNPDAPGGKDHLIQDLGSTNRTFVNGQPVERHKLCNGDLILIGKHNFKFIDEADSPGEKTARLRKSWIPGVYYTEV
jgi:pSer/pThr/pTyr-binding forkhead associated (FHA) protein